MDLTRVGDTVLLLLPGFLCVKSFNWAARPRRVTDLELTLWSIGVSVMLLSVVRPLLSLWRHQAPFDAILADPRQTSNSLRLALPLAGVAVGWIAGKLERWPPTEGLLNAVGFDIRRSLDVWQLELGSRRYVYLWLKDGTLLYGWPLRFSTEGGMTGEVSICEIQTWQAKDRKWVPNADPEKTALVSADSISYIELSSTRNPGPPRYPRFAAWLSRQRRFWFGFP